MVDHPHDALFKQTFSDVVNAAAELRAVLPSAVVAALDWDSLRLESGSSVGVEESPRHCDLLFSVSRRGGGDRALVFVLFEHQSSTDARMPLRMLGYMVKVWEAWSARGEAAGRRLPAIVPVVLSHAPAGWRHATRFRTMFEAEASTSEALRRFIPDFELVVDDIAEASDEELMGRALPAASALTLWALRDGRNSEAVLEHAVVWAPLFELLAGLPGGQDVVDSLMRYLGVAAGKRSVSLRELGQRLSEHGPQAREVVMNSVEKLIEEGRREGLREGLREGRAEGRREGGREARRQTLIKQLRLKFGELPAEDVARVEAADEETLERYLERVLTADSIAAVLGG